MQKTLSHKKHSAKALKAFEFFPTDPVITNILNERALNLAQEKKVMQGAVEPVAYVRFNLGQGFYGIPYRFAKEVLIKPSISFIPALPNFVAGVVNWRGKIVTIIDLENFFNLSHQDELSEFIIIIAYKDMTLGFLAKGTLESDEYDARNLLPALTSTQISSEYVMGLHQGNTAILNVEILLTSIKESLHSLKGAK